MSDSATRTRVEITQDELLRIEHTSYAVRGTSIVDTVSLSLKSGELLGLIGPNGAGKSTLLQLIAGLLPADAGNCYINNQLLDTIGSKELARTMGWLEQQGEINWPLSVRRLVSLGRFPHLSSWQALDEKDEAIVDSIMQQTDCMHLQSRNVMTLSGGERARVLLARVLVAEPTILLADEPVAALDIGHQLQTMDLLREFARDGKACICVLHDLSLAARYCDRLVLMDKGTAVADGEVAHVLSQQNIRKVYGVDVIAGCNEVPWIVPHRRVLKPGDSGTNRT